MVAITTRWMCCSISYQIKLQSTHKVERVVQDSPPQKPSLYQTHAAIPSLLNPFHRQPAQLIIHLDTYTINMFEILILSAIAVSLGLTTACCTKDVRKAQYQPYVRAHSSFAYRMLER